MPEPSVCAVLLTADRPEMTRQAVECFRAQTAPGAWLQILDSGKSCRDILRLGDCERIRYATNHTLAGKTIGELRNFANSLCPEDILIHFDSDDRSHPNRIAEQVSLLQSSGAGAVGFNEMLFAREMVKRELKEETVFNDVQEYGTATKFQQAWLYSNPNPHYALGTSLCYWRHVWERKPFEATSIGEDERFLRGLKVAAVSSRIEGFQPTEAEYFARTSPPRMIARIHAGNTSTAYDPRKMEAEARKKGGMWKRTPEWDSYCDGIFRSA